MSTIDANAPPTPEQYRFPTSARLQVDALVLHEPRLGSRPIERARAGETIRVTRIENGFACMDTGVRPGFIIAAALGFDVPPPAVEEHHLPAPARVLIETSVLQEPLVGGRPIQRARAGENFRVTRIENGFARVDLGSRRGFILADAFGFGAPAPTETIRGGHDAQSAFCTRCGEKTPPAARYCNRCGKQLTATSGQTNAAPSGTFFLLPLIAVAGSILALFAMFTMPVATCGPLEMKAADFGSDFKRVAFQLCGDFGGSQKPAAGVWVGALGGVIFFGAGGAAVAVSRQNNSP